MDLTMLPKSDEGHNYLVVAVDYLSNYVEAAPLKIKEAPAILIFFYNICSRFGFPKVVITDQGVLQQTLRRLLQREWHQPHNFYRLSSTDKWTD
ncbi:hypothetical protein ACOMHN_034250 [Nucella lapillus]